MAKNKLLNKLNKLLDKITEPVPEITDNGLNEDSVNHPVQRVVENKMDVVKKEKRTFNAVKENSTSTTINNLANTGNSLSQLLTATGDEVKVESVKEEEATAYSNATPVSQESSPEFDMERSLEIRDGYIEGFSDACCDVVEGIQSNSLLSKDRKIQKIKAIEDEYKSIDDNDFNALCVFFKKISHELHMIKNNVGEYDVRVYENNLTNNAKVMNYRIMDLHADDELYKYLAKEDMNKVESLLDMCEEIHKRAKKCGSLDKYLSLTEKRLRSSNTYLDLMVAEEKFDSMLIDLNVLIQTSISNTRLA